MNLLKARRALAERQSGHRPTSNTLIGTRCERGAAPCVGRWRRRALRSAQASAVLASLCGLVASSAIAQPAPFSGGGLRTVLSRDGRISANTFYVTNNTNLSKFGSFDLTTSTTTTATRPDGSTIVDNVNVLDITGNGAQILFLGDDGLGTGKSAGGLGTPPMLNLYDVASHTITVLSQPTTAGGNAVAQVADARITPDGSKVVFESLSPLPGQPATSTWVVYEMNVDGTNIRRVADTAMESRQCSTGFCPPPMPLAVSDDGNTVAFFTRAQLVPADTNTNIVDLYTKNLSTGQLRLISAIPPGDYYGVTAINGMSADGRTVAFTRTKAPEAFGVGWIVDATGQPHEWPKANFIMAADGYHTLTGFVGLIDGVLKNQLWVGSPSAPLGTQVAESSYGGAQDRGITPLSMSTDGRAYLYADGITANAVYPVAADPPPADPPADQVSTFQPGDTNHDGIVRWAILGDSYISGEGLTSIGGSGSVGYDAGTNQPNNQCHRARSSWAMLMAASYDAVGDNLLFAACSGAHTKHVLTAAQHPDSDFGVAGGEPQLTTLQDFSSGGAVDVVLVSIGGNDADFSGVIRECLVGVSDCQPQDKNIDYIEPNVRRTLGAIKRTAPGAEVFNVNYPDPVDPAGATCGSVDPGGPLRTQPLSPLLGLFGYAVGITPKEQRNAETFLSHLNAKVSQADTEAGIWPLDVNKAFANKGICTNGGLVNGLSAGFNNAGVSLGSWIGQGIAAESFHPTALGHRVMREYLDGQFTAKLGKANPPGTLNDTSTDTNSGPNLLQRAANTFTNAGSGVVHLATHVASVVHAKFFGLSLPHLVGTYDLTPDQDLAIDVPVSAADASGLHEIALVDADTGETLASTSYLKPYPADCQAPADAPDVDGDHLADSCDSDPTDGPLADADRDGVRNQDDNCQTVANPGQADSDDDGRGDACDRSSGANPLAGAYTSPDQDTIAPTVTGKSARDPDHGPWFTSPITIHWSAADPDPSAGGAGDPADSHISQDGVGQDIASDRSCDRADHCASGHFTVSVDATPPRITATADRVPDHGVWYSRPVTVSFGCADATAGVQDCADPVTIAGSDTSRTITGSAHDQAGNAASDTLGPLHVDLDAPTATISAPADNAHLDQHAHVAAHFACSDQTSGISSCSGPVHDGQDLDTATPGKHAFTLTVIDVAGNTTETTVHYTVADNTPPTITIDSPTDGQKIAQGEHIAAHYHCADADSAIAGCTGPVEDGQNLDSATLGSHTFAVTAMDTAGNTATSSVQYTVADVAAPTITITAPADSAMLEQGTTVPAHFQCHDEDQGSGVASCTAGSDNGRPLDTAAPGSHSFTVQAADNAGNTTEKTVHYTVTDSTPPLVTIGRPTSGEVIAQNTPVTVHIGCSDAGSGVLSCNASLDGGATTISDAQPLDTSALGPHSLTVTSTDRTGNTARQTVAFTIVDVTAPQIHAVIPGPSFVYEQGVSAPAQYSCTDEAGGSGMASCIGSVPNGQPIDTSAGPHAFTITATDKAGNRASQTIAYTSADHIAPKATITSPAGNYTQLGVLIYTLTGIGHSNKASFACQDNLAGSGMRSCTATADGHAIANGAPVPTGPPGRLQPALSHTFAVTATDNAGNTTITSTRYTSSW